MLRMKLRVPFSMIHFSGKSTMADTCTMPGWQNGLQFHSLRGDLRVGEHVDTIAECVREDLKESRELVLHFFEKKSLLGTPAVQRQLCVLSDLFGIYCSSAVSTVCWTIGVFMVSVQKLPTQRPKTTKITGNCPLLWTDSD